mmetsp:Transcript_75963/g.162977  ORF Transcript_75963/g.162977 Transcript_75963/m.162977 type:complete len:207 (+) Transcript_75963:943-1563(+)
MPLAVEMPAPVRSATERHAPDRMKAATPSRSKEGKAEGRKPGSPKTSCTSPAPSWNEHIVPLSSSSSLLSSAAPPPAVGQRTCSWMTTEKFGASRRALSALTCATIAGSPRIHGGTSVSSRTTVFVSSSSTVHRRIRKRSWTAIVHPQGGGEASSASSGMLIVARFVFTRPRPKAAGLSTLRMSRRGCGRGPTDALAPSLTQPIAA